MNKAWIIAGILLASVTAAYADEPAAAPAGPPPGALQLHALVGHWTGLGEMKEPGKADQAVTVVMNCVETAGGWGIRCDDSMIGKDMDYLESDLMGYDSAGTNVHWYAVTNAGEVHDQVAQWKDDKTLLASYATKAGSKSISETISLQLTTATTMEAISTVTVDGRESQSLTMKLVRSGKDKKPL
jgi:hypothetical protein